MGELIGPIISSFLIIVAPKHDLSYISEYKINTFAVVRDKITQRPVNEEVQSILFAHCLAPSFINWTNY